MSKSNAPDEKVQPAWYKRMWFLTTLSAISFTLWVQGNAYVIREGLIEPTEEDVFLSDIYFPSIEHILLAGGVSALFGAIMGYIFWATSDNFSHKDIWSISLLWAIAVGLIHSMSNNMLSVLVLAFILLLLAGLASAIMFSSQKQSYAVTTAFVLGVVMYINLVAIFGFILGMGSGAIFHPVVNGMVGAVFGASLTHNLRQANDELRQESALRQEHNLLASGELPKGEFTIGDDGELIQLTNDESEDKSQHL